MIFGADVRDPKGCRKALFNQKSLGVHEILVRKIWFYPPPKRAQNEEILYKSVENHQGTRFYGQNDFMDIWAFLIQGRAKNEVHVVNWNTGILGVESA